MNISEKDRIGMYLVPQLEEMIFDELSDAYLNKAGIADIMTGVSVPIRKSELGSISTLKIALNMAFVIGCDPSFRFKENYMAYILRVFDKRFAEGLIADGVEAAQREEFEYACIQFRAAIQLDPDNADAYYCYGRACKDAYEGSDDEEFIGRFKAESIEAFEVATLKKPDFANAYYFLGYGYINMGLYVKAQLTWEEFVKLSEDEELKKEIRGRLEQLKEPVEIEKCCNLVLSGKYIEGIDALSKYKEGTYSQWWPLWYYLGTAYAAVGENEEAIEHYLKVLTLSPSNAETMEELIKLYEIVGDKGKKDKYEKKLAIIKENAEKDRIAKAEMVVGKGAVLN